MNYLMNRNLTMKEKAMLAILYALPESWNFSIEGFSRIMKDGVSMIRATYKSLVEKGYVREDRVRGSNGRFTGKNLYLYIDPDHPVDPHGKKPHMEKPPVENPLVEKTLAGIRRESNTKEPNIKESKNDRYSARRPAVRSRTERKKNTFNNFRQREYDFADLERKLVQAQMREEECSKMH